MVQGKVPGELRWKGRSMAAWLWIYDNDFALCNWTLAQPSIKKDPVSNL